MKFISSIRCVRTICDILVAITGIICLFACAVCIANKHPEVGIFCFQGMIAAILYYLLYRPIFTWMISIDEATNASSELIRQQVAAQAKFNQECLQALKTLNNSLAVLDNNHDVRVQELIQAVAK